MDFVYCRSCGSYYDGNAQCCMEFDHIDTTVMKTIRDTVYAFRKRKFEIDHSTSLLLVEYPDWVSRCHQLFDAEEVQEERVAKRPCALTDVDVNDLLPFDNFPVLHSPRPLQDRIRDSEFALYLENEHTFERIDTTCIDPKDVKAPLFRIAYSFRYASHWSKKTNVFYGKGVHAHHALRSSNPDLLDKPILVKVSSSFPYIPIFHEESRCMLEVWNNDAVPFLATVPEHVGESECLFRKVQEVRKFDRSTVKKDVYVQIDMNDEGFGLEKHEKDVIYNPLTL